MDSEKKRKSNLNTKLPKVKGSSMILESKSFCDIFLTRAITIVKKADRLSEVVEVLAHARENHGS